MPTTNSRGRKLPTAPAGGYGTGAQILVDNYALDINHFQANDIAGMLALNAVQGAECLVLSSPPEIYRLIGTVPSIEANWQKVVTGSSSSDYALAPIIRHVETDKTVSYAYETMLVDALTINGITPGEYEVDFAGTIITTADDTPGAEFIAELYGQTSLNVVGNINNEGLQRYQGGGLNIHPIVVGETLNQTTKGIAVCSYTTGVSVLVGTYDSTGTATVKAGTHLKLTPITIYNPYQEVLQATSPLFGIANAGPSAPVFGGVPTDDRRYSVEPLPNSFGPYDFHLTGYIAGNPTETDWTNNFSDENILKPTDTKGFTGLSASTRWRQQFDPTFSWLGPNVSLNSGVSIANADIPGVVGQATMNIWYRRNNVAGQFSTQVNQWIMNFGRLVDPGFSGWGLYIDRSTANSTRALYLSKDTHGQGDGYSFGYNLPTNTWKMLTLVLRNANTVTDLYVDGTLVGTVNQGSNTDAAYPGLSAHRSDNIGDRDSWSDFTYWKRALSATEIKTLYKSRYVS